MKLECERTMRSFVFLYLLTIALRADDYVLGPDSQRQPDVPKGAVTKFQWTASKIYPGSTRDYWVYVPAQYKADKPACAMIFQDGGGMATETGGWRVPIVFDNLIHKGEMPVTIGIFINPGVMPALNPATQQNRYNRSYEYDGLGDRYARFLIEEILPEVGKSYNLSKDPNDYALSGSSSGGIAAFNAAWARPDKFHRVMSFVGSFTNLRGADTLAGLIRKTEPKPLRVFLQDGSKDQDIYSGNWYLANQEIYSSLQFAGYDSKFVVGTEGHNGKHGGAILPDALRWLWREYPKPVAKSTKVNERGFYTFLDPDKDWEFLGGSYQLTADSAVDPQGNVYFTSHRHHRIHKIDLSGKITVWKGDSGESHGLAMGPDGRLYAGQHYHKRIVAISPDGKESVIAEGVQTHHLTVSARGEVFFAESPKHTMSMIDSKGGAPHVVIDKMNFPKVPRVSIDQSLLVVNDPNTRWVWSFQIQPDGSLINGQPFYHLEAPDESSETEASGMAFDSEGFLYVATKLGIQVCDPAGRVNAIVNPPPGGSNDVFFAGANLQWLYTTDGESWYRRLMKRHGVASPAKPPPPRL